jgi:hypothetical protein
MLPLCFAVYVIIMGPTRISMPHYYTITIELMFAVKGQFWPKKVLKRILRRAKTDIFMPCKNINSNALLLL